MRKIIIQTLNIHHTLSVYGTSKVKKQPYPRNIYYRGVQEHIYINQHKIGKLKIR